MSELAVFFQTASSVLHEMFAKLSLILLLKCVELALITVEVVVIALLSKVSEDLRWGIVEVAGSSILITFVVSSFSFGVCNISRLGLLVNGKIHALSLDWRRSLCFLKALLALELDRRGVLVDLLTERASSSGRWLYLIDHNSGFFVRLNLVHHLNKFVK